MIQSRYLSHKKTTMTKRKKKYKHLHNIKKCQRRSSAYEQHTENLPNHANSRNRPTTCHPFLQPLSSAIQISNVSCTTRNRTGKSQQCTGIEHNNSDDHAHDCFLFLVRVSRKCVWTHNTYSIKVGSARTEGISEQLFFITPLLIPR